MASKCFYHLEEYNDALRLALRAGRHFDVTTKTEYVKTLISTCIEHYTAQRVQIQSDPTVVIDKRMEIIVEQMIECCFVNGIYTQAMGIALEAHRLDKVEEAIRRATNVNEIMQYTLNVCQYLVSRRETRLGVFRLLVAMHREQPQPDFVAMCVCLQFLNEAENVASILEELIRGTEDQALLAFQIALDIVESENQHFTLSVANSLCPKETEIPAAATAEEGNEVGKSAPNSSAGQDGDGQVDSTTVADASETSPLLPEATTTTSQATSPTKNVKEEEDEEFLSRLNKLNMVLVKGFGTELALTFLYKQMKSDPLIIQNIKDAADNRNSILHNASVVAHGYLNCGTTVDTFLRENLDWMALASNWAKFTATASIGVVHKGHVKESMRLLQPYLPQGGVSASSFSGGGSLYALGLIHANQGGEVGRDVVSYIRNALKNSGQNEPVVHGACLGLGLTTMATGVPEIYEELKEILYQDSAVAGEAAALSIGLLMLGCGNTTEASRTAITEMISYAHDTTHEKIVRGLGMGIALTMFGQEEEAEPMIEQLTRDRDSLMRCCAMYTIGMAYAGTGNNKAIERLLHIAVSDVKDEVRMAAVTNLGFISFRNPKQVPRLVCLLAESFNPLVRYGAAIAVGIACAGMPSKEAMDVIAPLCQDSADFVRQGALIAMAMVLMQSSESRTPEILAFRAKLPSIISDKHQSSMAKMGAILATGILDAGGRNATISLQSRAGFKKMASVVGMAIWTQYWYWYPLMHFMSLALHPNMIMGLNKDFCLPRDWTVVCDAKPSHFSYPKPLEKKKGKKKAHVTTVALSTSAKAKAREHRKDIQKRAAEEGGGAAAASTQKEGGGAAAAKQSESKENQEEKRPKADEVGAGSMPVSVSAEEGGGDSHENKKSKVCVYFDILCSALL